MATYSTDFSGGTIGSAPSGWTLRQDTSIPVYTLENIEGAAAGLSGQTLKLLMATSVHHLYCWDTLDSVSADMDLLTLCRASNKADAAGCTIITRCSLGASMKAYKARRRGNTLQLIESFSVGGETIHGTRETGLAADQWAWMRLRVNGNSIKTKVWAAWEPEPAAWMIEIADSTFPDPGWSGIFAYDSGIAPYYFAYFSAGSGGDVAPMPTPGMGELRLSSLFVEYLIRNNAVLPPSVAADYVAMCVN